MLRNPGQPYDFNGRREPFPDIRLIYWAGGNPFHHHQDLNAFHEAWQKPETIIVNEPWWTATAKRADIVFPATTPYEREDIGRTSLDDYLFHMPPADPAGGRGARRLRHPGRPRRPAGAGPAFTEDRSAADWIAVLYDEYRRLAAADGIEVPDLDELRERNWLRLPIRVPGPNRTLFAPFREDPEAAPLKTPSGRIESSPRRSTASATTTARGIRCGCRRGSGWAPRQPPPRCTSCRRNRATSSIASSRARWRTCRARGRRRCSSTPTTQPCGASRTATFSACSTPGVRAGPARAISDGIRPGVVALPTGVWFGDPGENLDPHGNPNVLTLDVGTSRLAQGSSAHTALVEVARLEA